MLLTMMGHEVRIADNDPELARMTLVALTGWGSEDARPASMPLTKPVESADVEDVLARFRRPSDARK